MDKFRQAVLDSGYMLSNREEDIARWFYDRATSRPKPTTPMNKVKLKAESDIDSLNAALDVYRVYEEEFDSLKDVTILLTPRGIELQAMGDARAVARHLSDRFDIIFTRRRVTDRAYDWVSEIHNVQIALILVEFVDEDLTGSVIPL